MAASFADTQADVAGLVLPSQPASQVVTAGSAVTFSVAATGALPLSYYWQRNGLPVAGATNSSYSTNNVQLADSGSQFSCLVSNSFGTLLSSNATLTVVTLPTDWFTELFSTATITNVMAFKTPTQQPWRA